MVWSCCWSCWSMLSWFWTLGEILFMSNSCYYIGVP
jgi:hypothetical protein